MHRELPALPAYREPPPHSLHSQSLDLPPQMLAPTAPQDGLRPPSTPPGLVFTPANTAPSLKCKHSPSSQADDPQPPRTHRAHVWSCGLPPVTILFLPPLRCPAHWPKATRFLFTHRSGEAASRVHSWGPTPRFTEAQLSRCSFPFSNPFWKNPKCSHRDLPDALSGQTLSGPSGCWAPPDPAPAHTPSPASTTRLSDVVAASRMHCFNLKQLK